MGPVVVCSSDAGTIELFAAQELSRYLGRMAAREVPVVPEGSAPAVALEIEHYDRRLAAVDSFAIRAANGAVTIRSAAPRGLLMGAYHYLQLLGCRFYFPGEEGELVPQTDDTIIHGLDVIESPSFDKRGIVIYRANSAFEDWIDFMPKAKLNALGVHAFLGTVQADRGSIRDAMEATELAATRGLQLDLEAHCFGEVLCPFDETGMASAEEHMLDSRPIRPRSSGIGSTRRSSTAAVSRATRAGCHGFPSSCERTSATTGRWASDRSPPSASSSTTTTSRSGRPRPCSPTRGCCGTYRLTSTRICLSSASIPSARRTPRPAWWKTRPSTHSTVPIVRRRPLPSEPPRHR